MSTTLEEQEAREARELEDALALLDGGMPENDECIKELLPRTFEARTAFHPNSDELKAILEFERAANESPRAYDGYLSMEWMREALVPVLTRADAILASRKAAQLLSEYVGTVGEPVTIEVDVYHTQKFENDFGEKHLTLMKDDSGNRFTYWNTVNISEGEEMTEEGQIVKKKRAAAPGDRVKFTATVKKHNLYKDSVKQTVLQRARKVSLVSTKNKPSEE